MPPYSKRSLDSLFHVFFPSYTYGAVSLSLNITQINKIHRNFMSILLTKLGFYSTFPRSIVFAPTHIGGIGITPFNVIITQRKIKFLYRNLRANTEISKVILINLQ